MSHVLAIDWANFVRRAFYTPGVGTLEALPYQVARMLQKVIRLWEPQYLLIAEDHHLPSYRYDIFPGYKQKRGQSSRTTRELTEFMRGHAEAWGLRCIRASERLELGGVQVERGLEGDDIIAKIAERCVRARSNLSILSRDGDLLSLVCDTVRVLRPEPGAATETLVDADWVRDAIGIEPYQVPDWKILSGDDSDDTPSIGRDKLCRDGKTRRYGFSPERAAELLRAHGTLAAIYAASPLLPRKEFDWLRLCEDQVETMRGVVSLRTDFDLPELDDPRQAHVRNIRIPLERLASAT